MIAKFARHISAKLRHFCIKHANALVGIFHVVFSTAITDDVKLASLTNAVSVCNVGQLSRVFQSCDAIDCVFDFDNLFCKPIKSPMRI